MARTYCVLTCEYMEAVFKNKPFFKKCVFDMWAFQFIRQNARFIFSAKKKEGEKNL